MSSERLPDLVQSRSLTSFIREHKEAGANGDLERMLERVLGQFGDLSLTPDALAVISGLQGNDSLSDSDKAELYRVLTFKQGSPNNHMSGKLTRGSEGWRLRQKIGCRYMNFPRRKP